jgi:CubicO group peptidase (beta-lactamase class C family)
MAGFLVLLLLPLFNPHYAAFAAPIDAVQGAWAARHGLTSAGHQTTFNSLTSLGYRLTYVSGYAGATTPYFGAIYQKFNGGAWSAYHEMDGAQYQSIFNSQTSAGLRLWIVNSYFTTEFKYTAIFRAVGGAWSARHGMSAAAYQTEVNNKVAAGWRVVHVSGATDMSDVDSFAAIFEPTNGVEWVARHGLSAAQYQAEFDSWTRQGFRLTCVSAYGRSSPRYAAIWEKTLPNMPQQARHGMTASQYQAEVDVLKDQGYRPVLVSVNAMYQFSAIFQNVGFDKTKLAAIDAIVNKRLADYSVPGISIAIAYEGRLVFAKGYGLAKESPEVKMTSKNVFRLASISKPITAVGCMRLVEQGKLSLSSKVFGPGAILGDDFKTPGQPYKQWVQDITVDHLLHHTAGGWGNSANDPMFQQYSLDANELITWTLQNILLQNAPGTSYSYSNFGYCVLGRIIEKITGLSYREFIQQEVLIDGAFNMNIGGDTLADALPNEVQYYDPGNPYGFPVGRMDSHGGWVSSAIDIVRFGVRNDGFATKSDLLTPATFTTMTTGSSANPNYACGWARNSVPNFWHGGSLPGTSTILVRTNSKFVWAALANSRAPDPQLDAMMWEINAAVPSWPTHDLF